MAAASPDGQVRVQLGIARAMEHIGDEAVMRVMLPLLHSLKGCLPIFAHRHCVNRWPLWGI